MRNHKMSRRAQSGFTLLEVMVAGLVMVTGVLGVAVMLATGMAYMNTSQLDYIAQQKAAEAVESIFTARDMGQATWTTICNVGSSVCSSGIFVAGPVSLCDPGPDGIVGTADDNCNLPDSILQPNGNTINNVTNSRIPLSDYSFQRTITISSYPNMLNLRQIQVIITYKAGRFNKTYTLTTSISNFS